MSISSGKLIQRRTLEFCKTLENWVLKTQYSFTVIFQSGQKTQ